MININNKTKDKINLSLVKKTVNKFLESYKLFEKEISIAFVSETRMKELNKRYRGIDKVTDVLSFSGEDNFFGEIVINYAQIKKQAKKFNNNSEEELVFILVHGLLHLFGYEDETKTGQREMKKLGEKFIKSIE